MDNWSDIVHPYRCLKIRTYWLCYELRKNVFLVMLWNRSNNRRQRWLIAQAVLLRHLTPQTVQIDILLRLRVILLSFIFLDQGIGNI